MDQDDKPGSGAEQEKRSRSGVRKILLSGIFWRILLIEAVLLIWSLCYRVYTQNPGIEELFWYALRIMILIAIIIVFMMVTFRRFLNRRIITPLEAIAASNRSIKEDGFKQKTVDISADAPREIRDIVSTRARMLDAILRVSRERLDLVNFIRDTFGRYLSKKIVDEILESPQGRKIGGRNETVTVLMSDLRGFTGLSETRDPEQLVQLLNRYLERMSRVILSYDGVIDEFVGDAILAIFGVPESRPDDTARAVACALSMQKELDGLNAEIVDEGYPSLEMGIGVTTGPVVVGNIGSQMRLKYGVVGTPVNMASRIESQTTGGQVLVGETTYEAVKGIVTTREPMSTMMKGFKRPLVSYPITAIGDPYNVALKVSREKRRLTEIQLPFDCWRIDGKEVEDSAFHGETIALNENFIRADISPALAPLTNIKIGFNFCTDVHCFGDIYAKVQDVEMSNGGADHLLRITFIDQKDREMLAKWLNS